MAHAGEDNREPTSRADPTEGGEPAEAGPAQEPTPRPWGPALLDSDSWETVPIATTSRSYEGRRRADALRTRRGIVVAAVVAGLVAVIAIPLALRSGPDEGAAAPALVPPVARVPAPTATSLASTGEAASTSSPPLTSTTTVPPARTTTTATRPTATTPPPPPPPPFPTLSFEGEQAELDGSAESFSFDGASGGRVAYRIGDWDDRAGDGVLTIRNIVIPVDGRYRVALVTVHPDGEAQRFGRLTVTGVNTVSLTFNGNSTCCQTTNVDLDLTAGTKTLTFTHSNRRAPSVDRIVISRL